MLRYRSSTSTHPVTLPRPASASRSAAHACAAPTSAGWTPSSGPKPLQYHTAGEALDSSGLATYDSSGSATYRVPSVRYSGTPSAANASPSCRIAGGRSRTRVPTASGASGRPAVDTMTLPVWWSTGPTPACVPSRAGGAFGLAPLPDTLYRHTISTPLVEGLLSLIWCAYGARAKRARRRSREARRRARRESKDQGLTSTSRIVTSSCLAARLACETHMCPVSPSQAFSKLMWVLNTSLASPSSQSPRLSYRFSAHSPRPAIHRSQRQHATSEAELVTLPSVAPHGRPM